MGPLLCLSEQAHLPDGATMVDKGHPQSNIATHLASQNFHGKHLVGILSLRALDGDLVFEDVGEGFVDH